MIITSVKKDKKHCVCLQTDDGRQLFIDTDVAAEYGLKAGQALDEAGLDEIRRRSDFVRAKERALWYLDHSDHTERALHDKLRRAAFPPRACAEALAWLKEYGMVDDRRFAERYTERCANANISPRETYAKLLQKGVPKELAREAVDALDIDECAQIRAVIEKKYANKLNDRASVQKVYAALARKGFSFAAVRDVLKRYCEELEYLNEE